MESALADGLGRSCRARGDASFDGINVHPWWTSHVHSSFNSLSSISYSIPSTHQVLSQRIRGNAQGHVSSNGILGFPTLHSTPNLARTSHRCHRKPQARYTVHADPMMMIVMVQKRRSASPRKWIERRSGFFKVARRSSPNCRCAREITHSSAG
ncbi:hypothetical protein EJ04DRAFT_367198 [Polyplosphaeria fusca]|uniref:Uncharacterized protein n=1 Tax=Polyplosphaeria fusca TaxID=682080 RepID=A0A9P4QS64_9PLEO|nr:hypothetical protein EJ04DRAFT_367198 [Polyplosphaeria fusca]